MLDLRGIRKRYKVNDRPLQSIYELVNNGLEAHLAKQVSNPIGSSDNPKIQLSISCSVSPDDDAITGLTISAIDNGIGFGPEERTAFVTAITAYKDRLQAPGVQYSKGTGRFGVIVAFDAVKISSVYNDKGVFQDVTLNISRDTEQVAEDDFKVAIGEGTAPRTKITCSEPVPEMCRKFSTLLSRNFSAQTMKAEMLHYFGHRLLILKEHLSGLEIEIIVSVDDKVTTAKLTHADIPDKYQTYNFSLMLNSKMGDEGAKKFARFEIQHYRGDNASAFFSKNECWLCAKSSPVTDVAGSVFGSEAATKLQIDEKYHVMFVEGEILDAQVNDDRDGFFLPNDGETNDLLAPVSMEALKEEIHKVLARKLNLPEWSRLQTLSEASQVYGVSEKLVADHNIRVTTGESARSLATRVLKKAQYKSIDLTSRLKVLKDEVLDLDPSDDKYLEKIHEITKLYASGYHKRALSSLAQLVTRRALVVDVLKHSIKLELKVNQRPKEQGTRSRDEAIVHSVLFPMGKDSSEHTHHDLWLLGEDYHYYDFVSSDRALSTFAYPDGTKMFQPEIDDAINRIFGDQTTGGGGLRPDIALFHEQGSVVVIELKAPGVEIGRVPLEIAEYVGVMVQFATRPLGKVYGYALGDTLTGRKAIGTIFPDKRGFFGDLPTKDSSGDTNGSVYFETLRYSDIADKAEVRVKIYREHLGI